MLMEKERLEIIELGKKLITEKLTKGTGGNLSVYDREKGLVAITPSGIDFFEIKPEDIVILDINGNVLEGDKKPSSELAMHMIFYKNREDINSVIHAHTMYATVLGALRWELPATHYMIAVAGKNVRCADYATFGSNELAENAYKGMKDRKAVILANHGILAGNTDLANTFNIIEEIEYCSEVYYRAKSIGNPVVLDDNEMKFMESKFKSYGQK